jgi:hypothetical protein
MGSNETLRWVIVLDACNRLDTSERLARLEKAPTSSAPGVAITAFNTILTRVHYNFDSPASLHRSDVSRRIEVKEAR